MFTEEEVLSDADAFGLGDKFGVIEPGACRLEENNTEPAIILRHRKIANRDEGKPTDNQKLVDIHAN